MFVLVLPCGFFFVTDAFLTFKLSARLLLLVVAPTFRILPFNERRLGPVISLGASTGARAGPARRQEATSGHTCLRKVLSVHMEAYLGDSIPTIPLICSVLAPPSFVCMDMLFSRTARATVSAPFGPSLE